MYMRYPRVNARQNIFQYLPARRVPKIGGCLFIFISPLRTQQNQSVREAKSLLEWLGISNAGMVHEANR